MDAKNFFLNRTGGRKASFQQHQFGASVGGPIFKDRTFFFGLYERRLVKSGSFAQCTVPTAEQLQGIFSNTRNANGTLRVIYDPFSTVPTPPSPAVFSALHFPGNRIPATMFDPVAVKALEFYPKPNQAGFASTNQTNIGIQKVPRSPTDKVDLKLITI